jgi:hypothetical protein
MGALITLTENALLNLWFRNEDITGIGDAGGLRGSATAGSWYFSLCGVWPGETASQNTGEASYTGYNSSPRTSVARSTAAWNAASNGTISPVNDILFGARTDTGAAVEMSFAIIGDSSSGAGTARMWLALADATFAARPFTAQSTGSDTLRIPGHGLAADNRIAFFNFEPFPDLPAGITEGVVYYVRSGGLTTDDLTVSTTLGGSAVDITTLGSGFAVKMKPLLVSEGINPGIAAGAALLRLS